MSIDANSGALTYLSPILPDWGFSHSMPRAELADGRLSDTRTLAPPSIDQSTAGPETLWKIQWLDPDLGLRFDQNVQTLEAGQSLLIATSLTNVGDRPLALEAVHALDVNGQGNSRIHYQGDWRPFTIYTDNNGSTWTGVKRLDCFVSSLTYTPEEGQGMVSFSIRTGRIHESWGGVSVLYDGARQAALACCALSWNRALTNIRLAIGDDGPLRLDARSHFAGLAIQPGETVHTEPLWIASDRDPLRLLERYGDEVKARNQPLIWPYIPMGFMSWYATRLQGGADLVLRNADFVKQRFADYPFEYCHWGHGWQADNSMGNWVAHAEKNPNGMKWLADELDKRGMKLGIFAAFLLVTDDVPLFREHPDWLLREKDGQLSSSWLGIWQREVNPRVKHDGTVYFLDGTHPEVQDFLRQTIRRLKSEGVKYFLFDFFGPYSSDRVFHDKTRVPGNEALRATAQAQALELDPSDFVYYCSAPTMSFVGLAHCVNCAADIGGPGSHLDEGFVSAISCIGARWYAHRRLWLTQPDALCVGLPGTLSEARVRTALVGLCGGIFNLSEDLRDVPEERLRIAETAMPPYGVAARPLDLFTNPYPGGYPQVWHLPVETDWDRWDVVGLLNAEDRERTFTVDPAEFAAESHSPCWVHEFWTSQDLGQPAGPLQITVPPRDTRLLVFRPRRPHPWVIATDMHLTAGAMEIQQATWDADNLTLDLVLSRRRGADGALFIAVPDGYTPTEGTVLNGRLALKVDFPTKEITRRLHFTR